MLTNTISKDCSLKIYLLLLIVWCYVPCKLQAANNLLKVNLTESEQFNLINSTNSSHGMLPTRASSLEINKTDNVSTTQSGFDDPKPPRKTRIEITRAQMIVGAIVVCSAVFVGSIILLITHILGRREVKKRPWLYKENVLADRKFSWRKKTKSNNSEEEQKTASRTPYETEIH